MAKANGKSREFDIRPHVSMLPKWGLLASRLDQAVGELVDNAIDAAIKGRVEVQVSYGPEMVVAQDDGPGMPDSQLELALRLGESKKTWAGQGGFGLGLKAAVMCLGRAFTITTAQTTDKSATQVTFDMEDFISAGRWRLRSTRVDKPFVHGTRIEVSKLHVGYNPQSERRLKERLARIFKRFLKSGELMLTVNGAMVQAEEPNINQSTRR